MKRLMRISLSVIASAMFLTSCVTSQYSILTPTAGQTYVGLFGEAPPNDEGFDQLPEKLTVGYDSNPGSLDVYLNGNPVGPDMDFGPNQASIDFSEVSDFIKQGTNTISVDPLGLGPTITFVADITGPVIAVKHVCYGTEAIPGTSDSCTAGSGNVSVKMAINDASDIQSVTVEGSAASPADGLYEVVVSQDSNYNLTATDVNGYSTTINYLADGETVSDIFKVRVADNAIAGLTPMLDAAITGTQLDRAAIVGAGVGDYLYGGSFGVGLIWVQLESIFLGTANVNNFDLLDPVSGWTSRATLDIDMVPTIPYVKNDDNVSGTTAEVGTYAVVDAVTTCVWADHPDDSGSCKAVWADNMNLLIETMDVNGTVNFRVTNGVFDVEFDGVTLDMGDSKGSEDGATFIENIVVGLKDTGLFQGIMAGIVETVLQENLNAIDIGLRLNNDQGHSFDMRTTAQTVSTDSTDMYMAYNGKFDVVNAHPDVPSTLGSYYVSSGLPDLLDDPSTTADNMAVTVNANMINQIFNTLYRIGMTHITYFNGNIHFGPDFIDEGFGSTNDLKIELVPSAPGLFRFSGTDTSQASLTYYDAALNVSMKQSDGSWDPQFTVNVDIEAGVIMTVENDVFSMTVNGSPNFNINSVENNTPLPVSNSILSFVMDTMIDFVIPQVADTYLVIDIPDVDDPNYPFTTEVTTTGFSTEGGHMSFAMGINPVPR